MTQAKTIELNEVITLPQHATLARLIIQNDDRGYVEIDASQAEIPATLQERVQERVAELAAEHLGCSKNDVHIYAGTQTITFWEAPENSKER